MSEWLILIGAMAYIAIKLLPYGWVRDASLANRAAPRPGGTRAAR